MIRDARVEPDYLGRPAVMVTLTEVGRERFGVVTGEMVGERLAIVVDGRVTSAPVVREAIPGGRAQIDLGDDPNPQASAEGLARALRTGALPSALTVSSVTTFAPLE